MAMRKGEQRRNPWRRVLSRPTTRVSRPIAKPTTRKLTVHPKPSRNPQTTLAPEPANNETPLALFSRAAGAAPGTGTGRPPVAQSQILGLYPVPNGTPDSPSPGPVEVFKIFRKRQRRSVPFLLCPAISGFSLVRSERTGNKFGRRAPSSSRFVPSFSLLDPALSALQSHAQKIPLPSSPLHPREKAPFPPSHPPPPLTRRDHCLTHQ
jgi:hypothetical protein